MNYILLVEELHPLQCFIEGVFKKLLGNSISKMMRCIAQIAIHLFKDNRGSIFVEEAIIVLNNRFSFVHHQYHNLVPHDSFLPLLLHFDSLAKH